MMNSSTVRTLSIYFHVSELCLNMGPVHHNVHKLFLQLLVRSRRLDEQLTATIIRIRPVDLGMAPAGFSGRAQHTALTASSAASVSISEMHWRISVFVSIFILIPLRELLIA